MMSNDGPCKRPRVISLRPVLSTLAGAFALLLLTSDAHAHLDIMSHNSRPGGDQKLGPCEGVPRGTNVHTFAPGETITLVASESIPHPGWFRISFDADGEDDFAPPASVDPPDLYTNDAVLLDDLDNHAQGEAGFGERREWEVTLPDVECTNCTLQIIQIMLDKPPYDPSVFSPLTGDIYYRCIDIELVRGESNDPPDAGSTAGQAAAGAGGVGGTEAPTGVAGTGSAQAGTGAMVGGGPSTPASQAGMAPAPAMPSGTGMSVDGVTMTPQAQPTATPAPAPAPASTDSSCSVQRVGGTTSNNGLLGLLGLGLSLVAWRRSRC